MKIKLLLVLLFTNTIVNSQEDAWVYFKDKPNAQNFYDNPLSELSQRSLDRRTIQGIALDIKDAPIHQTYVDQIVNANGITVLTKSKWLNYVHVRGTQSAIEQLKNFTFVDKVQYANHSLNPEAKLNPKNNAKVSRINKFQETMVNYNYGNSATQVQMLNCHVLHQQNYTGNGKIIAVLDAGFPGVDTATPFKRLRDNGLILGGYNFLNNSANFYTAHSHGTMVLSTMGGYATNLVGTAPDASYYLFITEDASKEVPLELSNWVRAAEEADRLGVDVINTSLGYFSFDNSDYSYSYSQMNGQTSVASRALDIAFSRGMICVTSAGNEGDESEPHIGTPADALFSLTVGSVTSTEVKSSFSSIGPTADNRIKPDVMAMGTSAMVSNPIGTITSANGTSFSGPIIAGAITSFWSAFPNKKNSEIVALVKGSADRFLHPDNNYGYGIPDFQSALNTVLENENFETGSVKIYPNPTANVLNVELGNFVANSEIAIQNQLGQKVIYDKINSTVHQISLESLAAGIYFYSIKSSEKTYQGKIIKK